MTTAPTLQLIQGHALTRLRELPAESVHCIVTSPPYYGLRDYGTDSLNWPPCTYTPLPGLPPLRIKRQTCSLGLESDPFAFIAHLLLIFEECHRVLRKDGTLWLNMGDSQVGAPGGMQGKTGQRANRSFTASINLKKGGTQLKPKDLMGQPWRLAFALQAAGWYLRQEIIWHKPNPMPESAKDRCTKAHEQLFLLSKSRRYYFDNAAIREDVAGTANPRAPELQDPPELFPLDPDTAASPRGVNPKAVPGWAYGDTPHDAIAHNQGERRAYSGTGVGFGYAEGQPKPRTKQNPSFSAAVVDLVADRNKRSVWTIPTQPFPGSHFATFPEDLVKPCILAGSPLGGTVLDPFLGSGTTAQVALELGRHAIGIELNPAYLHLARQRTHTTPGLPLTA